MNGGTEIDWQAELREWRDARQAIFDTTTSMAATPAMFARLSSAESKLMDRARALPDIGSTRCEKSGNADGDQIVPIITGSSYIHRRQPTSEGHGSVDLHGWKCLKCGHEERYR